MSGYSALAEIMLAQPGMVDQMLACHIEDRLGHCDVCGGRWPCTLRYHEELAAKRREREMRGR